MERHIEQLPSGSYRVRIVYRGHSYYSTTYDTLGDALEERDRLYQQIGITKTEAQPSFTLLNSNDPPDTQALEAEILERLIKISDREISHFERTATVKFPSGPIIIVFVGDVHLGSAGTDYRRVFADAETIASTPGMYVWLMGDLVDSFVKASIMSARFMAPATIPEEWILLRRYLRILAPKILGASGSGGHHDGWIRQLVGLDFFQEVLAQYAPFAIYDADEVKITFQIGDYEVPAKLRHEWKGTSIYNVTHGIERAYHRYRDFVLGVGAHFHGRAVARQFGEGMAVQVGSYKRADDYAKELGLSQENDAVAIAVLFDDVSHTMTAFQNLELASHFLQQVYKR